METDVLIVGAGPAGLTAALEIAENGGRAVLVDDNPQLGGQIWRAGPNARLPADARHFRAVLDKSRVRILTGARVLNTAGERSLLLETTDSSLIITYESLILCTGAREHLLPFPGWTLPGVTGVGGLQALIKSGYDVHADRVVVAGSGPLLLATAQAAGKAGAHVARIAEQTPLTALVRFAARLGRWPTKAWQSVALANRQYRWGTQVVEALGDRRVEAVRLQRIDGRKYTLWCERLACGYGLVPNNELGALLGCATRDGALVVDDHQATSRPGIFAAGECTGIGGNELARLEGRIAGLQAIGIGPIDNATRMARYSWQAFAKALAHTFALDESLRHLAGPDTIICRCEDVPRCVLDGETDWVSAKLENRCGMGACQGRICGPATEFIYGWHRPAPRGPVFPARIDTLTEGRMAKNGTDCDR